MTQENKELLLVDLCERLPYGVIVHFKGEYKKYHKVEEIDVRDEVVRCFEGMHLYEEGVINCFPYLRPMSSMNDKEKRELQSFYPGRFGGQWFDIEKGIVAAFDRMKNRIETIAGRRLKYCKGCEKSEQCQECIATQIMADDTELYMKYKCMGE